MKTKNEIAKQITKSSKREHKQSNDTELRTIKFNKNYSNSRKNENMKGLFS